MSLDRRLCRLEKLSGGCPECGRGSDVPEEIVVVWEDIDGPSEEEEGREFCEACGRPTTIVVTWEDLEEPEPPGEAGS